jgi:oligopeptidase B
MRRVAFAVVFAVCLLCSAAYVQTQEIKPPVAKVVPQRLEKHGHVRIDDYYWMRDRSNPEVREYLEAENRHTEAGMARTKDIQDTLFKEFKARIKQTDMSVPYKRDGYFYYNRVEEGKQYPIYCRKKGTLAAPEQAMLDGNEVAKGYKYCALSSLSVSSGGDLLAYGMDTQGRRFYTIRFKNLTTGAALSDVIANVTANVAWANDNKTIFYVRQDPTTLRSYQIYRHALGTSADSDRLVYEEKDPTFGCYVIKTKSKKYMMIISSQTLSTEYRYLEADNPQGEFQVFAPRQRDHEYEVDHYGDHFFIRTNLEAKNFRLMKAPVGRTQVAAWQEVVPHRADVLLEGMEIFKDHLVLVERREGLLHLRVKPWSGQGEHEVEFGEPAYMAYPGPNFDFDTSVVRYRYSSMTTPTSVYDYDMATRKRTLLKREEIGGGFDPANYRAERLYATAADGKRVPISLVYDKRRFSHDGSNPLLLYGYGSYGASMDAAFDAMGISLLDRGFVHAIAHVRGGQELGRQWYEDGKLLNKKNTFTDFIACAEHLRANKYADPKRVFARGGSAGGLLMGAVINMRPDLFRGIVADVPWVDVLTDSLDDTIPLTTTEYDEWGNPNDKKYYDYLLSYSPYDQVSRRAYPSILAMTSFQDSQVQYWDPAKWVARLRVMNTAPSRIFLKTEMEASHGGLSGRDDRYRQMAFRYAFLLDLAGIAK